MSAIQITTAAGICAMCDLLVDGRNFADRDAVEAAGFIYEGIGR